MSGTISFILSIQQHRIFTITANNTLQSHSRVHNNYSCLDYKNSKTTTQNDCYFNPLSKSITKLVLFRERYVGLCACVLWSIGRPESQYHDPFLKLDEFLVDKNGGFPDHPHHGFEAVTYMLEG
ncbi:hypothetical protein BKA57DRAFT_528900 [Linnemannia elongata]|nr:hypothetical protein BKA57DRAFT_528900 [Linnemannia elongata]